MQTTTEKPRYSDGVEIHGELIRAAVGSALRLDGRPFCEILLAGDPEPIGDGWPGCDFRYPNPIPEWRESRAIACNVTVTGRKVHWRGGCRWVRCRVEWVGDCEPSTYGGGWLAVD